MITYMRSLNSWMPILLCLALVLTGCESQRVIVNGLDEKEANEIIVFLSSKGISATKIQKAEAGGGGGNKVVVWDISVDEARATEAMALLNMYGLPRKRGQNLLGIFSKGGLVPSEMEEKIKYEAGLAEQIANTIRKIDGVLDADVQLSFPQEDPLNPAEKKGKVTASVYIKHSGVLDDPNTHLVTKIKRLVSSSITGLDYDNVTIISDRARFGDTLGLTDHPESEKQYVSVWSILVAKESLTRFRVIFFSFFMIVLFSILLLVWILWKIHPMLQQGGGIKRLFSTTPLQEASLEEKNIEDTEVKPEETPKESGEGPKPGSGPDQGVS